MISDRPYRSYFLPRAGRAARARPAPQPGIVERDRVRSLAQRFDTNGTKIVGRRRDYGDLVDRQSVEFETSRIPSLSDYEAQQVALRRASDRRRRAQVLAQASAADRRKAHPSSPYTWPSTIYGTAARTRSGSGWRQVFVNPHHVADCVRRYIRREVLFAKGKHGGRHRKPRRTWRSELSCGHY